MSAILWIFITEVFAVSALAYLSGLTWNQRRRERAARNRMIRSVRRAGTQVRA